METLLLCDAELGVLERFGETLRAEGYRVLTASNGDEAVVLALRERPDLVLMDIARPSPNLDGLEATRRIKAKDSTVVVIALTAQAKAEEVQRGLDAGCDGYLVKPDDPKELPQQVRRCLAEDV